MTDPFMGTFLEFPGHNIPRVFYEGLQNRVRGIRLHPW